MDGQSNSKNQTSFTGTSAKAPCQICWKMGHQALDYFHRIKFAYQGRIHPRNWQQWLLEKNTAQNSSDEQTWYANSGANNYVISALENLTIQDSYKGDDEVAVGNGDDLSIAHTSSSTLCNSNNSFQMKKSYNAPLLLETYYPYRSFVLIIIVGSF